MTYDELTTALEHIILDNVATAPILKPRKIATSSSMDTGMAAKGDASEAKSDEEQAIWLKPFWFKVSCSKSHL